MVRGSEWAVPRSVALRPVMCQVGVKRLAVGASQRLGAVGVVGGGEGRGCSAPRALDGPGLFFPRPDPRLRIWGGRRSGGAAGAGTQALQSFQGAPTSFAGA